jgi:DeoR family transcriptional regulator of aga operon
MRQADRLSVILEDLSDGGSVSVSDLSRRLNVSAATIRRDLGLLEENRLLRRTHGGAVTQGLLYELPLRYKSARHQEEKRRIAQAAVELVPEGASLGLTGGTTTTEVARALVGREQLTIVTNALNIASELAVRPNLRLVVTGGMARARPTSWWARSPRPAWVRSIWISRSWCGQDLGRPGLTHTRSRRTRTCR